MSAIRIARPVAALALAVVLATGCTTDRASPTGSAPASLPASTVAEVTDAPTTTQAPTAATPLVHQAVVDYWTALHRCQQRPSSCRPATFTAEQGALRADVTSGVATMVTNGWYRAADDNPDDTTPSTDGSYVVVGPVTVADDGTTATAEACVDDPSPMLGPGGAVITAGGPARHFVYTVYLEGQTWRLGDEQIDTSDACNIVADTIPPDLTTPGT